MFESVQLRAAANESDIALRKNGVSGSERRKITGQATAVAGDGCHR
jgi:hypothetical protein